MDTFDLNKAISCMDPKVYAECFPDRKKNAASLDKAIARGVIGKDRIDG